MQAELWHRIEELFQAALQQPVEGRAEFVREACGGNADLQREVETLLENASENSSFLQESPFAGAVLRKGQTLGNFEIVGPLGSGGMGEVYRARDSRLKRDVAIKVLLRAFARDEERLARFEREARAASALNHPNIVCVYDIGRQDDTAWIASELVEGQSLRQLLAKGPLPLRRAIDIARQIADGLAAAHAVDLVHRDLKPENVMVARDGRVKILDFGLAKRQTIRASDSRTATITRPGIISGTPDYMSPEQIGGRATDQRSDLFSLGVVVYEMLAGTRPFAGETHVAVMNAVLTADPAALPASIPAPLARLIFHCLEKEPTRRLQAAADFSFALEMPDVSPPFEPRKTRRWLGALTVALAVALTAAGTYWLVRNYSKSKAGPTGSIRRLTWDSGFTSDGAISPDGKLVAYASDRDSPSNLDVYVQQIESGGVVRLTDDPADDHFPTFSPDGSKIAFRSERGSGGIYEIPALGGEARLVTTGGEHPRFSPDGRYLLYTRNGDGNRAQLFAQPLGGGLPILLSTGCFLGTFGEVWWPDSDHVLFTGTCGSRSGSWLGSVDHKGPVPVETADSPFVNGLELRTFDQWLGNPARLLMSVHKGDISFEVTSRVSAGGALIGPLQRLIFGTANTYRGSASSDGRVVLSSFEQNSNVWRLPLNPAGRAQGEPTPLTSGLGENLSPALSRDGQTLAFATRQSGAWALQVLRIKRGTQQTVAREASETSLNPVFNATGDQIAFSTVKSGVLTAREVATNGGVALPVSNGEIVAWSSRDDLLSFGRGHFNFIESGHRGANSTMPFLMDGRSDLWESHFSTDERWVTFVAGHDSHSQIFIVPFRQSLVPRDQWIQITDDTRWDDKPHFSADGKQLYFLSDRDGHRCIWAQPLTSQMHPRGEPLAVYHSHSSRRSIGALAISSVALGVSRDFLVFNQGERTGNIWLLDPN